MKRHPQLCQKNNETINKITNVLTWSQSYMRQREDECSFVSLRDVERAMTVFDYFYDQMARLFGPLINKKAAQEGNKPGRITDVTRAIILAVSVCYHARLQERRDYETGVSRELNIPGGVNRFRKEIQWLVVARYFY